jgi:hypothetical protein
MLDEQVMQHQADISVVECNYNWAEVTGMGQQFNAWISEARA